MMANDPQGSKDFLKQLLSFQKQNGSALHQFNPLTLEGNEGDSLEREDRPHYYSDDHLWSVLCVTAYIRETGDVAFLDEKVHFYEKDPVEAIRAGSRQTRFNLPRTYRRKGSPLACRRNDT